STPRRPSREPGTPRFGPSARLTPANAITMARILVTPVVVLLILEVGVSWLTAAVWVGASSTDFLDGWVARRHGATTSGAFLDPLADKFLVLAALAALAVNGEVSWLPVGVIGAREAALSGYRSLAALQGVSIPARPLAKLKTVAQDLAVTLLVAPVTGAHHAWLGRDVLWAAVVLAVLSALQYYADSRRRAAVAP
ncbi:MAG: CDP-diacylglycerol--glycerol-3-phosphate 3-phosphatidyltransferase, partial [Acidimicrobiales bacterium]